MCATSTSLDRTREFGINDENVFGMWDCIGGRFSVSSPIGMLPLSLIFGFEFMEEFLQGLHYMDM